ncbi:MAG: hypothetical protein ACR2IF_11940 [Terriglobales bacterium]
MSEYSGAVAAPGLTAGEKLRRRRIELGMTLRDVTLASMKIAADEQNEEFAISISRISDIEVRGAIPGIYRIRTISQIYLIQLEELLRWYHVLG